MKIYYISLIFFLISEISFCQNNYIIIQASTTSEHSGVDFVVENSLNQKTGYNPLTQIVYKEIPNANYGDIGFDDLAYTEFINHQPTKSTYIISCMGIGKKGDFTLVLHARQAGIAGIDTTINGRIAYGEIIKYKLIYDPDPSFGIKFESIDEAGLPVKLINSQGQLLQGGTLKYYEGGWKEATDHGDGTFTVDTEKSTISLRMTYAYASQDMSNVPVGSDTVTFQTVNVQVELRDSQNQFMDEGTVKYYAGGWRNFGVTSGGVASKELLPNSYKFRMTYGFASNDYTQDISIDPTVTFQTVQAQVELRNSQNNLIDEGTVKYYSGGWRDFNVTSGGIAVKELLPNNYKFRMTYGYASNDKMQDISANPTVIFQTVNAQVELRDSQSQLMDEGTVKYYAGGWREFGVTSSGIAKKELLPNSYKFRMTFEYASNDLTQDISVDPTVVFKTVSVQIELRSSQNQLMDEDTVKYYAGGWRDFNVTSGGIAVKELLPNSYKFRMSYAYASEDKTQDVVSNPTVSFQTVQVTVNVEDAQEQPVDGAAIKYYSGGWRDFGITANGMVQKELLAMTYKFRMSYQGSTQNKEQDVSTIPMVEFIVE